MTTILLWLSRNRWAWFAIGGVATLAVLAVLIHLITASMDRATDSAYNTGVAQHRADDMTETLNRVRIADNAAEAIDRDHDAWVIKCRMHARNPDDCD